MEGKENNEIAIVGEYIDPVSITQKLRKKMGCNSTVEMVKAENPDKDKDKEKEKEKEADKCKHPWCYYPQPQIYSCNEPPACSIL